MNGTGFNIKGILALIGLMALIAVGIGPWFRFIFKDNKLSRVCLVGTIFVIAAFVGAAKKGVLGEWVSYIVLSIIS